MKIKPLSDYIVVDTKEKAETTKSGFILPSASADKYVTAKAGKRRDDVRQPRGNGS